MGIDIKKKKSWRIRGELCDNGIIIRKDEVSWKAKLKIDMCKPGIKKKKGGGGLNDRY